MDSRFDGTRRGQVPAWFPAGARLVSRDGHLAVSRQARVLDADTGTPPLPWRGLTRKAK